MSFYLSSSRLIVLMSLLLVMPGCKWFQSITSSSTSTKEKKEKAKIVPSPIKKSAQSSGIVLCSINGDAVIRESDFKQNVAQMLQSNPYFKGAGPDALPGAIKRKLFDELVKQELIVADASAKNLYENKDFIEAYENMTNLVKRSLAVQFFEKRIYEKIDISDTEVTKHYEENKSRFVKVAGGVLVSGAKFSSSQQAERFLAQASKDPKEFEKQAKQTPDSTLKNFGRVSKQAGGFAANLVPAQIKEAALGAKRLPKLEKIVAGKDHWVIIAHDKKDTEFFNLEEIKPQIKGMIKNNKFRKQLDQEISSLKGSMSVNINEEYFKEAQKEISANDSLGKPSAKTAKISSKSKKITAVA